MAKCYKQLRISVYWRRSEALYRWGLKYTYMTVQLKLLCTVVLLRNLPILLGQRECCYDRHLIVKLLHSRTSEVPERK
jgi:hypothetical protein